jgi:MinD-like ATPase involved in chromosome partitioning or flagellar assembly
VCVVDTDIYAPSLLAYFGEHIEKKIKYTVNDYLIGSCKADDLFVDISPISKLSDVGSLSGKITACFSSPKREDILKIEGVKEGKNRMNLLKRFIELKEQIGKTDIDYIIIDSASAIAFWAINAIAISEIVFITQKMQEVDISGYNMIFNEVLNKFKKQEISRNRLVLNMVPGYCVPNRQDETPSIIEKGNGDAEFPSPAMGDYVSKYLILREFKSVVYIPCYCDIQFARREFLTVLKYPNHPFAQKIEELNALINTQY